MSGLSILLTILLLLVLAGLLPVGLRLVYDQDGLFLWGKLGPATLRLLPAKENRSQRRTRKQKSRPAVEKKPLTERVGGAAELIRPMVPLALEAAGQFKRKLRIRVLRIHVTAGAPDPGDAALIYGQVNAALGALWQPLVTAFRVKDGSAHVDLDYSTTGTLAVVEAIMTLRLAQILKLAIYFGVRALSRLLAARKSRKRRLGEKRKAD